MRYDFSNQAQEPLLASGQLLMRFARTLNLCFHHLSQFQFDLRGQKHFDLCNHTLGLTRSLDKREKLGFRLRKIHTEESV